MAQFETGYPPQHPVTHRAHLSQGSGNPILGGLAYGTPPKKAPELIRQRCSPASDQDAKPAVVDKTTVKCRQIVQDGRPKIVMLHRARHKFKPHQLKCQECRSRDLCAGA